MSDAIRHYTNEFRSRRDISPYDAEFVFDALSAERDEDLLTEFLSAWSTKGATEDEIYRFAAILRDRMKRVDARGLECVDIVGTGGSSTKTFNVSTAAAFVVAAAGIPVAKHGNKAATSSSGSADVLSTLGIRIDVDAAQAEANLHEHGICFMFAPRHHSLSSTLARARKRVGSPTIFNLLGPLCNPASAPYQVIGVWDDRLRMKLARVLFRLGTKHSWIVNSIGSLDEIGLQGVTQVVEVDPEAVETIEVTASDFGITTDGDLPRDLNPMESASLIIDILADSKRDSAPEQLVLVNASAAILLAGRADDLTSAYSIARESIRSCAAFNKLNALRGAKK
ncbi:MAG TPA: anthranilate phosphoribosyltransferase [Pyrinomonadaceae bacterium]|nr:anthranilate phosphoribosyltransferase [Pyrinomonadaceae bacterium]